MEDKASLRLILSVICVRIVLQVFTIFCQTVRLHSLRGGIHGGMHDSALKFVTNGLTRSLPSHVKLFVDLPSLRAVDNPPT